METDGPEESQEETSQSDNDWENRILCSDGNCIGVIGPDGRCKECGKKHEDSIPEENSAEKEDLTEEEEVGDETAEFSETDESSSDSDWENRVLCSDGNCIGVIGPDGRCKECGKPSSFSSP